MYIYIYTNIWISRNIYIVYNGPHIFTIPWSSSKGCNPPLVPGLLQEMVSEEQDPGHGQVVLRDGGIK